MPSDRHFFSRQCWHRLRLVRSTTQLPLRGHWYRALFCCDRRKNPYKKILVWFRNFKDFQLYDIENIKLVLRNPNTKKKYFFKSYLATFACNDSIMNTRTSVPTDFAWNNLNVGFSRHWTKVFSEAHFVVILTCRTILTRICWYHCHFSLKISFLIKNREIFWFVW